jgi:hypothetical protein
MWFQIARIEEKRSAKVIKTWCKAIPTKEEGGRVDGGPGEDSSRFGTRLEKDGRKKKKIPLTKNNSYLTEIIYNGKRELE